jgi:F0F1-type ATP synthase assembly protein I
VAGPPQPPRRPPSVEVGRYLGHGLTIALAMALFLWVGWQVDRWLGTLPLFFVIGALVGAFAGFYNLYHQLVAGPRRRDGQGDGGKAR